MLGHAVWLNLKDKYETFGSIRSNIEDLSGRCSLFNRDDKNIIGGINLLDDNDLKRALDIGRPGVIVN